MAEKLAVVLRTREEVADVIRGLSDADWGRLRKVAVYYARGNLIEAEDLAQEAFRRALDGGRNCPVDISVVKFLAEAMRSIAHGEKVKGSRQPTLVPIADHGSVEGSVDPRDPTPNGEERFANCQGAAAMKDKLITLFEDDPIAQVILEGLMEGRQGVELRDLTELDATAYQSKRRLIRRRIDKSFPDGWKP